MTALQLSVEDFGRLEDGKWLNDNILNGYLRYLADSNDTLHVYTLPTQLYMKVSVIRAFSSEDSRQRVHSSVRKWLPKELFTDEPDTFLLLPANVGGNHWVVLIAHIKRDEQQADSYRLTVSSFDSMGMAETRKVGFVLRHILWAELESKGKTLLEISSTVRKSPQQTNGCDCGLYAIMNAKRYMENHENLGASETWFTQADVQDLRAELRRAAEIKEWEVPSLLQATNLQKKRYVISSQEVNRRVQEPEILSKSQICQYLRKRKGDEVENAGVQERKKGKHGQTTLFSKICEGEAADLAQDLSNIMTGHLSKDILPPAESPERVVKVQTALNILEEVGDGVAEQLTEDGPFSLMTHTFGPEVFRSVLSFVTDTLRSSLPDEQEGEQEA